MTIAVVSLIISSLVAIGVIYREFIHDLILSPNLKLTFSLEKPISRVATIKWPPQTSLPSGLKGSFWLRLRVQNDGKSVARNCEGILAEVTNPYGEPDKRYDPLTLGWAIAPIERRLQPIDIAQGRVINLNIFTTIEGEQNASFHTYQDPRGVPLYLEPGDYWLGIVIYGDNFKPVQRGYAVHWDGEGYKRVDMREMNQRPHSGSHWPWPIESAPKSNQAQKP
jgi:hypothetical protein